MLDIRLTDEQYLCLLDDLLVALSKETEQKLPENLTTKQKRWLIDALLEVRSPGELDETILAMQDKLLSYENIQRGVKTINQFKFNFGVANVNCDIDLVKADVCVIFSPSLVCAVEEQTENEKQVLNSAGVQVKEAFSEILQEYHNVVPVTKAYIVPAANLPAKNIAKVLIGYKQHFAAADYSAFDLAIKDLSAQMKIKNLSSVVFDLKSLYQIEPALAEIVKREFKLFKKLKIKILKNS